MLVLLAAAGLAFGAGDQYLGSIPGRWTVATSLLSAPWLAVPFLAGVTQVRAKRAAAAGATIALAALAGYFLMVMSPFEGGRSSFTAPEITGLLGSNVLTIVGGLVLGPLYGLIGHYWRIRRSFLAVAAVAAPLCLEPLFHLVFAGALGPNVTTVGLGEAVAGLLLGIVLFFLRTRHDSTLSRPS